MDEDLDSLVQRYALRRNVKLGEQLGFGIHGIVFAAEDNIKPGFFAVNWILIVSRLLPLARPLPHGFTGHVARPSRSIVSQLLAQHPTAALTALPAMSLAPVAPFNF